MQLVVKFHITRLHSIYTPEIGITGIYIDSLWESGSDIDKFNLYGNNLKTENEKIFLQAIKTLKFKRKQVN